MCTHLHRRGNRYYIRRRIPLDLVPHYGRHEYTRALGTSDYTEARAMCRRAGVQLDEEFEAIRQGHPVDAPRLSTAAPHAVAVPTPAPIPAIAPTALASPTAAPVGISLSDLAGKWEAERRPDRKSIEVAHRIIKSFETVIGKLPASAITRAHTVMFKDKLMGAGKTAVNTNKYLTVLNVLLNFGVANGDLENNPARGVKVVVKQSAKDARHPFDLPALQAIFSSPVYTGDEYPAHLGHEAAYWIPLLALFTGARREELCQLRPEDVYEEVYRDKEGQDAACWVMRITDSDEGQGVKNAHSVRRVPLHAELIARDFLEFVRAQKGKPRLFDKLKARSSRLEGDAFGKWFSYQMRNAWGITDSKLVFHSFRHCFKDYCREAEIPEEVSDALSGHSSPKVSRRYGGLSYPLRPLVEAVQRYRVPGLVLPPKP